MSLRHAALSLVLAASLAPAAGASDLDALSDAERAAFGAEVRRYLLENPEVLVEAIAVLERRQQQAQAVGEETMIATNAEALFDDGHSYVGGNPDGDVTLVEFLDYRCGFCRRAHPEVAELLAQDGGIRWVVKEFPILGEESTIAARAAMATLRVAGPEAYDRLHDALMTHRGPMSRAAVLRVITGEGIDAAAVAAEMDSAEVDRAIAENHALAQRLGISGTPSFVLGDRLLRGYMPLDEMQAQVAALRERADTRAE